MFRLADPNETYKRTVPVRQPQAGGGSQSVSFTAYYHYLDNEQLNEILTPDASDYDFCSRILSGWEGIQDHNGEPLEFSTANLRTLCGIGYWTRAVVNDYLDFQRGEPVKN